MQNSIKISTYFSIFLFLENFFNLQTNLFNRTNFNVLDLKLISYINLCYIHACRLYKKTTKQFHLYSYLYLLITAFMYQDLILLRKFCEERFKSIAFKKHKRILSMLRYTFKLVSSFMIKHNIILGFYISISGKIGAAGSTKKKK